MNFFKLLCFLIILGGSTSQAFAQQREVGLRLTSLTELNNLGFIYKKSLKKENRYFRISSTNLQVFLAAGLQMRGGVDLGWEKRQFFDEHFAFIHGWTTGASFSLAMTRVSNVDFQVAPHLGYLLGVQYQFNDRFYVNVETNPTLQVRLVNYSNSSILLNANSDWVRIWFVYRFQKK